MNEPATEASVSPSASLASLRSAWFDLRAGGLRTVDIAARLGVAEAQLLDAARGEEGAVRTRRLRPRSWAALLGEMPELGPLKTVTRNPTAVIEVEGSYGQVEFFGAMGQSVAEVDLRIFVQRWRHGFLVEEETRRGVRRSLQFFDAQGVAIHKAYATAETRLEALSDLVQSCLDPEPGSPLRIEPAQVEPARADADIDVEGLRAGWRALTDTHQFFGLLRRFGAQRVQALRLAGEALATRVETSALERTLRQAASAAIPLLVFVGNAGVIQIHTGPVRRVVDTEGWLNVLDPRFNLHVLREGVASVWVVRKPTLAGVVTSLEVYDRDEQQSVLLVGQRKGEQPEDPAWRALVEGLVPAGEPGAEARGE